ncbi:superoxide dismutase family protein [Niveibacterium umoris]|uniref:Superoxide dismutase [Cu-Zn] n=1 Tax=Niveibacterium umoris TaxID=1193620 RepID=A0A840BW72_9RHOO|nr:superoxide dismutase family protein [Niveibacterium umoris]MBB4014557.1 Cu-Zn family superoxide dismutase [Niveibacterium umoris]
MHKKTLPTLFLLGLLSACASTPPAPLRAVAEIRPTASAAAAGLAPMGAVSFVEIPGGKVHVDARVSGLKPNAEHGFHVHDVADCSGDGTKTAGHLNPDQHPHGHPGTEMRHAGAMFNLKTDASGVGVLSQDVDTITLTPGKYGIVGKPVIVHRDADDYHSQPLGNAGPRIGCGIITAG